MKRGILFVRGTMKTELVSFALGFYGVCAECLFSQQGLVETQQQINHILWHFSRIRMHLNPPVIVLSLPRETSIFTLKHFIGHRSSWDNDNSSVFGLGLGYTGVCFLRSDLNFSNLKVKM